MTTTKLQQVGSPRWLFLRFLYHGLADIVGVATNYIKNDFALSSTLSNTIPLWYSCGLHCSLSRQAFYGKNREEKTVLLALLLTVIALIIPMLPIVLALFCSGSPCWELAIPLQVSLNPLVASLYKRKDSQHSHNGQLIKSISSFDQF